MDKKLFLTAEDKLQALDAVAAIIVLEDGRYVMQLRDAAPNIFYPDHWGCFGGAVDEGENPAQALRRELLEELEFEVADANEFVRFDFDLTKLGQKKVYRIYYEIPVAAKSYARFTLREGAQIKAFSGTEILCQSRVTPYDAYAIWLHMRRSRFQP
ncbi:MAG TPA: NUDIX domain-containing protein [Burkholderiales bacterium]|nr:NUDIX domain-containing protein [Burkholderiales bacterium]